jgi:hypothetical protein
VTEVLFIGKLPVNHGDRVLVKLTGEDADPGVNVARVRVSSRTDTNGFELALTETGPDTGIYVAALSVGATTDAAAGRIAALVDGEEIVAVPLVDPDRRASLRYEDRTPPSAPRIACATHPSLVQNTFEATSDPLGDWRNVGGKIGATLNLERSETMEGGGSTPSGSYLKLTKIADRGHFGAIACAHAFDVRQYPLLTFDYRIPADVKLEVELDESRLVRFNDDAEDPPQPTLAAFRDMVGRLPDIVSDGAWHRTALDLAAAMGEGADEVGAIREIRFINWDKAAFRKLEFGRTGSQGASWCIDNFRIVGYGGRDAEFSWSAEDEAGVAGYGYVLDHNPETMPGTNVLVQETRKTFRGLDDGRWYFHVRARDVVGNWGPANHHMVFVDETPPVLEAQPLDVTTCSEGSALIRLRVDDGDGSGVSPATLRFRVGGLSYGIGSTSVTYDAATRLATFNPAQEDPRLVLFNTDSRTSEPIRVEATDCAGHRSELVFRPTLPEPTASPLRVTPPEPDGSNCWYTAAPRIKCDTAAGGSVAYAWDIAPEDDEWFRKGNSINRLVATATEANGRTRRYVRAFRLDSTVPRVTARADADGRIVLEHDDYARAPGGLNCVLYRTAAMDGGDAAGEQEADLDLSGVTPERLRAFRAARWRGMLNVRQSDIYTFLVRLRVQQAVALTVDGEMVLQGAMAGKVTEPRSRPVLLKRGLHSVEISAKAPDGRALPVRLFWSGEGQGGEGARRRVSADALLALRPLARIFYRLSDGVEQTYAGPIAVPIQSGILRCRAEDEAGHRGVDQVVDAAAVFTAGRQQAAGLNLQGGIKP